MKKLLAMAFITILLAPAPYGIAINYETKECAGYWGGDEFVYYTLPAGWVEYYPDDNGLIQTEIGACEYGWNYNDTVEDCCNELGYTYVSENIGKDSGQRIVNSEDAPYPTDQADYLSITIISAGIVVIIVLIYGVYRELKRK